MDPSKTYETISAELYKLGEHRAKFYKSRSYKLTRFASLVVKQPVKFVRRGARLLVRNPKKAFDIARGARQISSLSLDQTKLAAEYGKWINDSKLTDANTTGVQSSGTQKKPLISLVTPVFDPPKGALTELIESVLHQSYTNLELFLYNFGEDPEIEQLLDKYARADKRVKTKHNLPNEGIGKNSNLCLQDVRGDYVALLDHDDALVLSALTECVNVINKTDADFIYSDKDKITEEGMRFEPLFKPDWSPEMALGGNYMTHFNLMRTRIVRELGGWDPTTDGAQDWDLFLRIAEVTNKISHVPKILYHWRTVSGSTANGITNKPYAMAAQVKAVAKHLKSIGVDAVPFHDPYGQLYIKWPTQKKKRLFIVHGEFGDKKNIAKIIKSIKNSGDFSDDSKISLLTNNAEVLSMEATDELGGEETVPYKTGSFTDSLIKTVEKSKADEVVFIRDSINKIDTEHSGGPWISQLTGWLDIDGLEISGCGQYSERGHLVDMGSFYSKDDRQFHKLYFGTGQRSGYLGPKEWIRNMICVSEGLFAFSAKAVNTLKESGINVEDHEFAKALAISNHTSGRRAVYDPLVVSTDLVSFELSVPLSRDLDNLVSKKIGRTGDPYYNINLNDNYTDPKPKLDNPIKTKTPDGIVINLVKD